LGNWNVPGLIFRLFVLIFFKSLNTEGANCSGHKQPSHLAPLRSHPLLSSLALHKILYTGNNEGTWQVHGCGYNKLWAWEIVYYVGGATTFSANIVLCGMESTHQSMHECGIIHFAHSWKTGQFHLSFYQSSAIEQRYPFAAQSDWLSQKLKTYEMFCNGLIWNHIWPNLLSR
jgi:hypothetical protein